MSEELNIKILNLVTLLEVCDTSKPLMVYDEDSDCEINVWDMIEDIRDSL